MATAGDLVVNFLGNAKQLEKTVTGVKGQIDGVVSFAKKAAAALAVGFSVKSSIEAAEEQIRSERKLQAVLSATGGAAGLAASEIQELASQRQAVTNFGDEATVSAAAMLATFKDIKGNVFKDALVAAQDLSSVMETDLNSSIVQIGKALNDPIRGVTALRRVGVSFSEEQLKQIKVMQEAGDVYGAQKIILKELQGEFGGAAEAMATGSVQMKNSLGDIVESVGMALLPAFNDFAQIVVGITPTVISSIETISPVVAMLWETFKTVGSAIWETFSSVFEAVGLSGTSSLQGIVENVVGFLAAAEFSFLNFGTLAELAFVNLELFAVQAFNTVTHFFTNTVPELLDWFSNSWRDVFFTIVDFTSTIFINLGENIRNIMGEIWDFIASAGTDSLEISWTPLADGFVNTIKKMPELTEREISQVEKMFAERAETLGSSFSEGMAGHIQDRFQELLPQFQTPSGNLAAVAAPVISEIEDIASGKSAVGKSESIKQKSALTAVSGMDAIKAINDFNREQEKLTREREQREFEKAAKLELEKQTKLQEESNTQFKAFASKISVAGGVK